MLYLSIALACVLVVSTLLDAFEVVLLPRPVRRKWRVNRFFFRWSWAVWAALGRRLPPGRRREDVVGVFGPLSMVLLFSTWGLLLIFGFGLLHWAVLQSDSASRAISLAEAMVISGDAFFTLGYGDVVPHHAAARLLVIAEAGIGFGFIALTIGYLPVLYQHFSRRDYQLIELSSRAGSPPTAAALLRWHAAAGDVDSLVAWLRDWEIWASDITESHSAYPMLAFYRSQHEGQSWLAGLAVVLDTCALLIAGSPTGGPPQAAATFAAARRALDVVAQPLELGTAPQPDTPRRQPSHRACAVPGVEARVVLPDALTAMLRSLLPDWRADTAVATALDRLRRAYEPTLAGLAAHLLLPLPPLSSSPLSSSPEGIEALVPDALSREGVVGNLTRLPLASD